VDREKRREEIAKIIHDTAHTGFLWTHWTEETKDSFRKRADQILTLFDNDMIEGIEVVPPCHCNSDCNDQERLHD